MKYSFWIFIVSVVFLTACTKTEVECKKRHATSIKILALPSGFDLFGDPDLRCDIATDKSNYWSYKSHSADNVSGLPITLSFVSGDILLSKESWAIQLVDEDAIGEEQIYFSTFDPYNASDGTIRFYKDEVEVMNLNYTESE